MGLKRVAKVFAPAWEWANLPPVAMHLVRYFNHPFGSIQNDGSGWVTLSHPVDEGQIWAGWQSPDRQIGLRFGKQTLFGCVDIDAGSPHHNDSGLRAIRWALEDIGILETVLIQSSRSGGWHLYFGLPKPVNSFGLACALHQALEAGDVPVVDGEAEIYPNRKQWQAKPVPFRGLRLPMQAGAYLLDNDYQPYSTSLETFLTQLDATAQTVEMETLEAAIWSARRSFQVREDDGSDFQPSAVCPFAPHNPKAKQWKKDLETAIAKGWTANHQTNGLIGQIAEYGVVFRGLTDEEELTEFVHSTAIACPGFVPHCRHQRNIKRRSRDWARSAIRHRYPYGTRKGKGQFKQLGGDGLTNEERQADAMRRVADAVAQLKESNQLPDGITARMTAIAKLARCSYSTLSKQKYRPLWHPDHDVIEQPSNPVREQDGASSEGVITHPNNKCCSGLLSPYSSGSEKTASSSPRRGFPFLVVVGSSDSVPQPSEKKINTASSQPENQPSVMPLLPSSSSSAPSKPESNSVLVSLPHQKISPPAEFLNSPQPASEPEQRKPIRIVNRPPLRLVGGPDWEDDWDIDSAPTETKPPCPVTPIARYEPWRPPSNPEPEPELGPPPPNPFSAGDWVIEKHRPTVLFRFESIDPDGWFCRCRDVRWGGRVLCYLPDLLPAPPQLLAEEGVNNAN